MQFADEAFDILGFTKEEKYDVFKVSKLLSFTIFNNKIQILVLAGMKMYPSVFSLLFLDYGSGNASRRNEI